MRYLVTSKAKTKLPHLFLFDEISRSMADAFDCSPVPEAYALIVLAYDPGSETWRLSKSSVFESDIICSAYDALCRLKNKTHRFYKGVFDPNELTDDIIASASAFASSRGDTLTVDESVSEMKGLRIKEEADRNRLSHKLRIK